MPVDVDNLPWDPSERPKDAVSSGTIVEALRIGIIRSESLMRWVWEANRNNPVRENATLTFSTDRNLVLADADGRIACFDSPTDTLLVGQYLRAGGPSRLVSRISEANNVDGTYSLVMEPEFGSSNVVLDTDEGFLYYLTFEYFMTNPSSDSNRNIEYLLYNNTYSYLRLGIDGNLRFLTYNRNVQGVSWEVVYTFLDSDSRQDECQLLKRCGKLGLCEDIQWVACPTPNGMSGWSKDCKSKKVTSCKSGEFGY
ncbi:hypothetical protein L6452_00443 [Arctium lappa]|uniref:Uncharacterized protein n=1 Tax=Arctium lappa TaxID=4217 RepID=A0ACB9FE56_ARCLA|nr:hypothetical protein L6452_00443 [Arctium lappa]